MAKKSIIFLLEIIIFSSFLFIPINTAIAANLQKGEKIFQRRCLRCHLLKKDDKQKAPTVMTLAKIVVQKIDKELNWLISWIKNPKVVNKKATCKRKGAKITDDQALDIIKYLNSINIQEDDTKEGILTSNP